MPPLVGSSATHGGVSASLRVEFSLLKIRMIVGMLVKAFKRGLKGGKSTIDIDFMKLI